MERVDNVAQAWTAVSLNFPFTSSKEALSSSFVLKSSIYHRTLNSFKGNIFRSHKEGLLLISHFIKPPLIPSPGIVLTSRVLKML